MRLPALLLCPLALLAGDSKPVARKDLPAPVQAAFTKAYPQAKLKACSSEIRDGQTCFELESVDGRTRRDLIYAAGGQVLEIEEAIPASALPSAVQEAAKKLHPKARITAAEKVTRGAEVTFEVDLKEGGKKVDLVMDGAGRVRH